MKIARSKKVINRMFTVSGMQPLPEPVNGIILLSVRVISNAQARSDLFYAHGIRQQDSQHFYAVEHTEQEAIKHLQSFGSAGCFCGIVIFKSNHYRDGCKLRQRKGCPLHPAEAQP